MERVSVVLVLGLTAVVLMTLHTASCKPAAHHHVSRRQTALATRNGDETASAELIGSLGGFLVSQLFRLALNRLGNGSPSPSPPGGFVVGGGGQVSVAEETPTDITSLLDDELLNELRELLNGQTPAKQQSAAPLQASSHTYVNSYDRPAIQQQVESAVLSVCVTEMTTKASFTQKIEHKFSTKHSLMHVLLTPAYMVYFTLISTEPGEPGERESQDRVPLPNHMDQCPRVPQRYIGL